jgi:hypothetical protein
VHKSIPFERKFEKIVFSSNISKIPEFILNKEMEHRKKRERKKHRKKERKEEKLQKSLSFEKWNSIF